MFGSLKASIKVQKMEGLGKENSINFQYALLMKNRYTEWECVK